MIHQLKTEQEYFAATINGSKPFEVRMNDRDFRVGDFLALNEIIAPASNYTGRCCMVEITYVLTDERFVKKNYAILGVRPCGIAQAMENVQYHNYERYYEVPVYGEKSGMCLEED